jgi:hypothetical protein
MINVSDWIKLFAEFCPKFRRNLGYFFVTFSNCFRHKIWDGLILYLVIGIECWILDIQLPFLGGCALSTVPPEAV